MVHAVPSHRSTIEPVDDAPTAKQLLGPEHATPFNDPGVDVGTMVHAVPSHRSMSVDTAPAASIE